MAEVNEKQQFKCLGDCLNCRAVNDRKQQWWYCAAQFSYNASQMMRKMQESLDAMSNELEDMKKKISAIQDAEAEVYSPSEPQENDDYDPLGDGVQPIAQEGAGAEK